VFVRSSCWLKHWMHISVVLSLKEISVQYIHTRVQTIRSRIEKTSQVHLVKLPFLLKISYRIVRVFGLFVCLFVFGEVSHMRLSLDMHFTCDVFSIRLLIVCTRVCMYWTDISLSDKTTDICIQCETSPNTNKQTNKPKTRTIRYEIFNKKGSLTRCSTKTSFFSYQMLSNKK
jgi:hypothetical protein